MRKFSIKFPLELKNGKLEIIQGREKIEQAIKMVLTTYLGERWGMPEYGCKIFDYLFQPDSIFLRSRIRYEIEVALKKWIAGIHIENIVIEKSAPTEHLSIQIFYREGNLSELQKTEVSFTNTMQETTSITK